MTIHIFRLFIGLVILLALAGIIGIILLAVFAPKIGMPVALLLFAYLLGFLVERE